MKTMRPPAGIFGSTAADTTKVERRLARRTLSKVSGRSLRTKVPSRMPAACTRRSTRSSGSTTAAKDCSSAASAAVHLAPIRSAASCRGPGRREVRTTSYPFSASSCPQAKPMPPLPPVTTASLAAIRRGYQCKDKMIAASTPFSPAGGDDASGCTAEPGRVTSPDAPAGNRRLMILLAMAMFVLVVDTSLMNVSISAVVHDLDTTASGVQSAIALEALVSAAFILINSKVGDLIGRKRAYVLGLLAYAAGALAMMLAQGLTAVIVFWAIIGGLGASLLLPAMQSLIHGNFTGAAQKKAYALVGAAAAIAAAVGPLLGGFIT